MEPQLSGKIHILHELVSRNYTISTREGGSTN